MTCDILVDKKMSQEVQGTLKSTGIPPWCPNVASVWLTVCTQVKRFCLECRELGETARDPTAWSSPVCPGVWSTHRTHTQTTHTRVLYIHTTAYWHTVGVDAESSFLLTAAYQATNWKMKEWGVSWILYLCFQSPATSSKIHVLKNWCQHFQFSIQL